MRLTRRTALLGLSAAWTLGPASLGLGATSPAGPRRERRLVVVLLRGALDGLAAVTPYGDPGLAGLRAPLVLPGPGEADGLLDLGGFFGLHPALSGLHGLHASGEMLVVHAVAGGYRSRSHFDAQDYLESGADQRLTSGWLNRVVGLLPHDPSATEGEGLCVGTSLPLLLRGPAPIGSDAPELAGGPSPDLYGRIAALNAADPLTGPSIAQGLRAHGFAARALAGASPGTAPPGAFASLARTAGRLLAAPAGPRIAALEIGGWDTHAAQRQRLAGPLRQLDEGLAALRVGLGEAWRETAVLVMTEFGRTVRANGTGGTDHGTATVAFVLGGAVQGGRVAGSWPGLSAGQLLEGRDLAPTTDLRAVAKGVLAAHLGLDAPALETVFPGSAQVAPMARLIRA